MPHLLFRPPAVGDVLGNPGDSDDLDPSRPRSGSPGPRSSGRTHPGARCGIPRRSPAPEPAAPKRRVIVPGPRGGPPPETTGVARRGCAGSPPDRLVGGADVERLRQVGIGNPEDIRDMFGQLPEPFLALPLRLLSQPTLGDIPKDDDDARDLALIVLDGGGVVLDELRRPVPGDEDHVIAREDDLSSPNDLGDGEVGRPVGRLLDRAEDLLQGATHRLRRSPAGESFGDRIQGGDTTLGVGRDHGIGDAGQGDAEPLPMGLLALERPSGLGGARLGTALGGTHRLDEQGDGQPESEEGVGDLGVGLEDREGATTLQEEVIDRPPGEDEGHERGPEAAVPGGEDDGNEEGEERETIAQEWVEGESDRGRQGDGEQSEAISQERCQRDLRHIIALDDAPIDRDGLGSDPHGEGGA